jgi:hypothetical protein
MTPGKKKLMNAYTRAIVHMREQKAQSRFGLIFGAGISMDFGFPSWWQLIERIANDKRVLGNDILKNAKSNSSVSQLLFQNFKLKTIEILPKNFDEYDKLNSYIQSEWHKVVHDALYIDVPNEIEDLKKKDPYLNEFLSIIKETRLTVNYNFDDTLQTLLSESRTKTEKESSRGFRTVWNADIQLFPQNGVIYHPNGFLPNSFREKPSDNLIFLEDSFGDQLIDSNFGHYAALSYHLSQNTCLFIGLSLEDSTLKHLLRKNVNLHPGHIHYFVYYIENHDDIPAEHRKAIIDANFEVYNLVTLFLTKKEIAILGQLLSSNDEEIELLADEVGKNTTYRFFLTGSVCVGKSTSISNFRSIRTHDEWLDQRVTGMEKDPTLVDKNITIQQIDDWVAKQWRSKNFVLYKGKKPGIDIIDRCPLDAFAFTPEGEWKEKAILTRKTITPENSSVPLCKGKIILLIGNPETMAVRALKLQKDVTPDKLKYRQNLLRVIYDKNEPGIVELDTREKSIQKVTKEISKIIHIDNYSECDLQQRLEQIEKEYIKPQNI